MRVSIIIPTFNRAHLLQNIFNALAFQKSQDFEVIVSIDGSTDNTIEVVEKIKNNYHFQIRTLNNAHKGRAHTRNEGAKFAQGDLLIFYDDDVRPNPKSVETHLNHHLRTSKSICAGPAYYEINKLKSDFQIFRANMEHSWYPKENRISQKAGMPGANWSILKSDFCKVGMLQENLTDSEDFEFSYRATKDHGMKTHFNLDTWVYHDDYKTLSEYLDRYILGNISLLNLLKTDSSLRESYKHKLYIKRNLLKSIFFRIFNNNYVIKLTNCYLFSKIPTQIRYKVYDFIITAQTRYFLNENFNSRKTTQS